MGFDVDKLEKEVDARVEEYKREEAGADLPQGAVPNEPKTEVPPQAEPPQAEPQPAPNTSPPVAEEPKAPPEGDDVAERLKMMERELKRLSNENRHLKIEVGKQAEVAKAPLAPEPPAPEVLGLTPEERELLEEEGFSEDILDVLAKRLRPDAYPAAPVQDDRTAERLARVEQDVAATRQTEFETALTQAVPDWEAINSTPRFINWLKDSKPEFVDASFEQVINHLGAIGDAVGVAKIFDRYKATLEPGTTQDRTTQHPTSTQQRNLENEVSPRPSGTAPVAESPGAWDGPKVKQFYQDWADGRLTDEEARKVEAQIYKAVK